MENFVKIPWGLIAGILIVIIISYNLGKNSGNRKIEVPAPETENKTVSEIKVKPDIKTKQETIKES